MGKIVQNRRLVAVVGASGAGKDTLLEGLVAACPEVYRARRTISRPPSANTEDFESVTLAEFDALHREGAFALFWWAHGLGYGIRHCELDPLAEGRTVVFNGSRKALPEAVARYPDLRVVMVSVMPEVLAARLTARGRETAADIARRLERADTELPAGIVGQVVRNDGSPEEGIARLIAAVQPVSA